MNKRINKLRDFLIEKNLDAMLITSVANLMYFSGFIPLDITDREAYVFITRSNAYILTSKLYADEVKVYVKDHILKEISASHTITTSIAHIITDEKLETVGFEEQNLTYAEYQRLANENTQLFPTSINHLRIAKDAEEVSFIAKACSIGDKTFDFILNKIKVGVTEKEIAFEMEMFMRKLQVFPSFPTIVAFGPNAAIPHHVTGDQKLESNTFVLLDFGVKYKNYCSDMTRTVFVGTPSPRQKKIYEAVLDGQKLAIEHIENIYFQKEIVHASEADSIARNHIIEQGYPSFPHSLGHGIGIQVHEAPSLSPNSHDTLESGMVFSVEPGIYITDDIGVRIEDLVAIVDNEVKVLTNAPNELITL